MPIVILFAAILLIAVGLNNTITDLVALLKEDMKPADGSIGFPVWILAIVFVGAIGYVKDLKWISNGFLIVLFFGIILAAQKGTTSGFFTNFTKAFGLNSTATNANGSAVTLNNMTLQSFTNFVSNL